MTYVFDDILEALYGLRENTTKKIEPEDWLMVIHPDYFHEIKQFHVMMRRQEAVTENSIMGFKIKVSRTLVEGKRVMFIPSTMPPKVLNVKDLGEKVFALFPEPEQVYIGRGSRYGNPYVIGIHGTRDEVCDLYEADLESDPIKKQVFIEDLRGKSLVCHCAPLRCHGDYLLRIANDE